MAEPRRPKVTVNEGATPSAAHTAQKPAGTVTDGRGRRLRVKQLNALARVDFADILGQARTENQAVSGPAAVAFSVVEIDGDAIPQPNSWAELRALIARLDDDGIAAAAEAHVAAGWVAAPEGEA